jgi:hypothetical protein
VFVAAGSRALLVLPGVFFGAVLFLR